MAALTHTEAALSVGYSANGAPQEMVITRGAHSPHCARVDLRARIYAQCARGLTAPIVRV